MGRRVRRLALLAVVLAGVTVWRNRMISANERPLERLPRK
jgi:hypothetical protein